MLNEEKETNKYMVIHRETGEVIEGAEVIRVRKSTATKQVIDGMLSGALNPEDIDSNLLFSWCRMTGNMNKYNQIKLGGVFIDPAMANQICEDVLIAGYVWRLMNLAHTYSSILMSCGTHVKSWSELWGLIDCHGPRAGKLKKFLKEKKLLRETTRVTKDGEVYKCFVLNPFLLRKSTYVSSNSVVLFRDFADVNKNMSVYVLRFLQSVGEIE